MGRIVFQHVLAFLLPSLGFLFWLWISRRWPEGKGPLAALREGPVFWLVASGLVLVLIGLGALAFFGRTEPGGKYIGPRWEDGEIVPGHVVPAPPAE